MTDEPKSTSAASSAAHQQFSMTYLAPESVDARVMRVEALRAGVVPKRFLSDVTWTGHDGAMTITALRPAGNEIHAHAADLGLWIGGLIGHFLRMEPKWHTPAAVMDSARPYRYTLGPVVLLKSGRGKWSDAEDPAWVKARIEARLQGDIQSFADAWGIELPSMPVVTDPGRVLSITAPVVSGGNTSWLVATGVKLDWKAAISGMWHIGGMAPAGFGRLWYEIPSLPAELGTMSVAEQMEALS